MSKTACSGRTWLGRLAVSYFVCLGLAPAASAQQHMIALPDSAELQPAQPAQQAQPSGLTLADCLGISLQRQPTLAAHRAGVAAAEAQRTALDHMFCISLISREMGFRKQQSCLGVSIAQAGLHVAEWETTYAVTHCYFSVVYARKQELLAKGLLDKLEVARKNAQGLVQKGDPDAQVTQVDVDKLTVNIDLVQLRLIEASTGVNRATAALREAMGLHYDTPISVSLEDLPPVGDTPDRQIVIQQALSRRGEMVQAYGAASLAELEVCRQNTGCILPLKMTFAAGADIHAREIPQGSSNGVYKPSALGMDMPTTLVGHKTDRVARARELSNRAGSVVQKTQGLIALEAEDAFYKWHAAANQVATLRESAAKSAKLADLISGRFDNGKVSGEDYLRARTLEDQTQAQLNEALYHHALGLTALERVTAGGFTPSFRRPTSP